MKLNPDNFWGSKAYTFPTEIDTLYERLQKSKEFVKIQQILGNPFLKSQNTEYFDILKQKVVSAQDATISETQNRQRQLNNLLQGTKVQGALNSEDDLSDETIAIQNQINYETQVKFLQMYFDAYMAPKCSDIEWRLGKVTGTVLSTDKIKSGQITGNLMHTRSAFSFPFYRQFWDCNLKGVGEATGIKQKREYYSTMFFPPYKVSPGNDITSVTSYMGDIYAKNPTATFDIDNFLVQREDFTYRDPGFKSLTDYISYLQWVVEGATGIVHTYLTEWDLSLYMQEGLMSGAINGAPLKLFLNYRVKQDNPLSSTENVEVLVPGMSNLTTSMLDSDSNTGKYTDDRALVFNVAGSSVSKLEFDCNKLWRPSDFPLSAFWLPYRRIKDWDISYFHDEEEIGEDELLIESIPYMDIYDTVNSQFQYESSDLRGIVRNQDYLGAIMGTWANFDMKYANAFYSTPMDAFTDFDIKSYADLNKVAGADYGVALEKELDLNSFVAAAKESMLLNGGYRGYGETAAGLRNNDPRIDGNSSNNEGDSSPSNLVSKQKTKSIFAIKNQKKAANDALKANGLDLDLPLNQTVSNQSNEKARSMLASGLNNNVDASSMANFNGMNRFSPAIFGGPHGSDYSPNTIQGYFDENSQLLRNIPRIDPTQAKDSSGTIFKSENAEDFYQGLNALYDDGSHKGLSPARCLSHLMKGITAYTINYGYKEVSRVGVWVEVKGPNLPISSLPQTNSQGYKYNWFVVNDQRLVNFSDKRIEKTEQKTKVYTSNPFTNNDFLTGNFVSRPKFVTGSGWQVTYQATFRRVSYLEKALCPYKEYVLYDDSTTKWEIVQHKFEQYEASFNQFDDYWKDLYLEFNNMREIPNYDYKSALQNLSIKHKPMFILKFWQNQDKADDHENDPELKLQKFLEKQDKPTKVFFFQGNESQRTTTGPECIFEATLGLDYYKDVQENFEERRVLFFKRTVKVGESYRNHPYITVDLDTSEIIADDLQYRGYSNRNESGQFNPMHLNTSIKKERSIYYHIMQKMRRANIINKLISFKSKKVEKKSSLWAAIVAIVSVAILVLAFPASIALVGALGVGVAAVGTALFLKTPKQKKDENYDEDLPQTWRWTSFSSLRLSGIGFSTNIQGISPDAENIEISSKIDSTSTTEYNFKDKMTIAGDTTGSSFNSLPFSAESDDGGKVSMDSGMQKALLRIFLRPRMKLQKTNTKMAYYNYVTLDTPIRNFLSVMLTQVSYYKFIKNSIIGNVPTEGLVNFDILYKILTTCVDRCILKASGLSAENQRIEPDRDHIYYDYWIDEIIQILDGTDIERLSKKEEIRVELQQTIDLFESTINILEPICLKDIEDWSLGEIITSLNLMAVMKDSIKVGKLEKFLFGYLRILYYYRFFFIAKRFNKENGTMWIMRALESVLEFIVPTAPTSGPPPSPIDMMKKEPTYNVAFYEVNNTTQQKREAIVEEMQLDPDKITTVYVRVQWATELDYIRWLKYKEGKTTTEYDEVVEVVSPDGIKRWAFKPFDGFYTLISSETIKNDKNVKWNKAHPYENQKIEHDFDKARWWIDWEDSPNKTPIKWNVFGNIGVDNLLQYAKESISPDELLCLIEEGADFWTVFLPVSIWPRAEAYQTKIKIKQYSTINSEQLMNDPMINILGPAAYTIYPVALNQEKPFPGVSSDNPTIAKLANYGIEF